jgi:RHS repeat-associated protein
VRSDICQRTEAKITDIAFPEEIGTSQLADLPTRQVAVILTDHLGSPIEVHDMTGALRWTWYSDAFGTTLPDEDPGHTGKRFTLNIRFPGQYHDAESGLHYNGQRYYAPTLGRYVSSDPIGLVGGANTFAYVRSNPTNSFDPRGLADLLFVNGTHTFTVLDGKGNVVGDYPAANNAQSGSRGAWASGTYEFSYHTTHTDDAPNSAFGANGNFVFDVSGCVGCGVHSGRATSTDRAGRTGVNFATNGCIRTTDAATEEILKLINSGDPVETLTVIR